MSSLAPADQNSVCPDPDRLRAFRSGRLPAVDLESVADHLAVCTACAAAFDGMGEEDPVVCKLRQYLPTPTPPLDPECERLAAAACMIPLEPTGAATSVGDTETFGPKAESAAPPPRRFAGYELLERLGTGGMGVVWKARQVRLNRLVALKMIRHVAAEDGPERERFRREGEAVARVRHANIVEVYDADEEDGQPYIAMELLKGGDLARRMRQRPYTPREAAGLMRTLALAVQAAHDAGVVHRDLKPTNVLFAADGTPKVADFGLAKFLDAETAHTRTGDVLGTPSYMAPEQARGDGAAIGPRTDVFALGVILYELLYGKPPFRGANPMETLAQVLHHRPDPPAGAQGEDRRALMRICRQCLEKEPGDRYPSAAALAEDLDRWLDGRPTEAKRPGPLVRAGRFLRRRRFLSASLAVCGLGATAGLTGWYFWRPDPDAAVKEIEGRLARGEAVELLGQGGQPVWSRWELGGDKVHLDHAKDGAFTVHTWEFALMELLPHPGMDRYRIRAEVRQEEDRQDGSGQVGLYFGCLCHPTPGGLVRVFLQLTFNDIHDTRQSAVDWNLAHPNPKLRVPDANPLLLQAHAFCPDPDSIGDIGAGLSAAEVIVPNGWNNRRWRSLAVEVAPEEVRVFWDGTQQPTLTVGSDRVEKTLRDSLKMELDRRPSLKDIPLSLAPHGSLGLCVLQGAASFQNVRVEPLGSAG